MTVVVLDGISYDKDAQAVELKQAMANYLFNYSINKIEGKYKIKLTLFEKVPIRKYIDEIFQRPLKIAKGDRLPWGGTCSELEAELLLLRQHGISIDEFDCFQDVEGFKEYFRRIRERTLV